MRFANVLKRFGMHREMLKLQMDVVQFQTTSLIATQQIDDSDRAKKLEEKTKRIEERSQKLVETLGLYKNLLTEMKTSYREDNKRMLSHHKSYRGADGAKAD